MSKTIKFKVGDRVKVVKTGALNLESEDWCKSAFKKIGLMYPGGTAVIKDVRDDDDWVGIEGSSLSISSEHFALAGKSYKEKSIKLVLTYDEDVDPVEFFTERKDAVKRIKELSEKPEVRNIRLFEVKKEFKVETSKRVILKKV